MAVTPASDWDTGTADVLAVEGRWVLARNACARPKVPRICQCPRRVLRAWPSPRPQPAQAETR